MNEDELVEAYIPNNSQTQEFFTLSTETKGEVVGLGLAAHNAANRKLKEMTDIQWKLELERSLEEKQTEIDALIAEATKKKEMDSVGTTIANEQMRSTIAQAIAHAKETDTREIAYQMQRNASLACQIETASDLKESTIEKRIQSATEVFKCEIKRLTHALDKETERSRASQTLCDKSTDKGKHGEIYVQGELNKLFPCAEVEDTHAEPHRGDFIVRNKGLSMMVEAKNYKRNVQKAEIDKFYADVDNRLNSEYDCAIMLSLSSGICNREDFSFEIRNGIPIMFIHNASSNFTAVSLAFKFFKAISSVGSVDFGGRELVDKFKHIATTLRKSITKQKAALDKNYAVQLDLINGQQELLELLFMAAKVRF
jgi:hypothetical protein